jgi:DNA-binding NtrC family response regulator
MDPNNKILIVEDNLVWRESYKKWLGNSYEFRIASDVPSAISLFDQFLPDLIILDLGIPQIENGMNALEEFISRGTDCQVIVITSSNDHKHALEAQRRGADSYFFKGENIKDELPLHVNRALRMQSLERHNKRLRAKLDRVFSFDNIVAVSKPMQKILEVIEKVSNSTESILITGESGVGKDVIARHIHTRSKMKDGPFIALNCAAVPENLLENELFGHERGAFTGATDLKKGMVERADNGTLFLDEIGDMPITLQAKLLRLLQEKKLYRLGGSKEISVNFRLIAATNKRIAEDVKNNRFREDLYYRLNVIPIYIPPLKERPDDIPALVDYFIQKYCKENQMPVPRIDPSLITFLARLDWDGNIRQLENTIRRMLVLNNKALTINELPEDLKTSGNSFFHTALVQNQTLEDVSRLYVRLVLDHFDGNKKSACEFLNINYRTLQKKLES